MTFDKVEHHLDRCHPEVIWPQVKHWQVQFLHPLTCSCTSMVGGIVNHDHGVLPPMDIFRVEMFTQLEQEETECIAVGLTTIHCIEQLACAAESGNDVDTFAPLDGSDLVMLTFHHPSTLTMIGELDHAFVDVDHSDTSMQ